MQRDRRLRGSSTGPLLFLLLLLAGAGGWNYHRNLQLEQAEKKTRPFVGYADEDLAALADAYRGEVAEWQRRYVAASRTHAPNRQRAGLIDERVNDFERVQRQTGELRGINAEIATREHRLNEIVEEQQQRTGDPTGLARHVKRLVTI